MAPLPELARQLFGGVNFPTLTTLRRDGRPRSWVVWADVEEDNILVCTRGGWKAVDMMRNPRVALAVVPLDDPYTNVAVEGWVVEARPDADCRWIDPIARKYTGQPFLQHDRNTGGPGPTCFVIEPQHVSARLGGVKYQSLIDAAQTGI
jgi:PPOX class probable F420-dependent enzyme